MANDASVPDGDALRRSVDTQHRETFAHQAEVIQHVQDVKLALKQLFEKIVIDQQKTSKLFTDARTAIEAHNTNANQTDAALSLSEQLTRIEFEQIRLQQKTLRYRDGLDRAKANLMLLAEPQNSIEPDQTKLDELNEHLREYTRVHDEALLEIATLKEQLEQRAKSDADTNRLREKLAETEDALQDAESRALDASKLRHEFNEQRTISITELENVRKALRRERELTAKLRTAIAGTPGRQEGDIKEDAKESGHVTTNPVLLETELEILRPLRSEVRQLRDVNKAQEIKIENLKRDKERIAAAANTVIAGTKLARELEVVRAENKIALDRVSELEGEVKALEVEVHTLRTLKDAGPREDIAFDEIAARQQLGDLLVASGVITQEQLDEVIAEHGIRNIRGRIGTLIVSKGYASEDAIAQALAHQMNVPFIRLKYSTVRPDAVNRISGRLARAHNCIPVSVEGDELKLAMANPMDLIAIENVEHATEFRVAPCLATFTDINNAIKLHYLNTGAKV